MTSGEQIMNRDNIIEALAQKWADDNADTNSLMEYYYYAVKYLGDFTDEELLTEVEENDIEITQE